MKYRIETDTIGEVKVPESVYWGPQTERSRQNLKLEHPTQCQLKSFMVMPT